MAITDDFDFIGAVADNFDCDANTNWTPGGTAVAGAPPTATGEGVDGGTCLELRATVGEATWYHNVTSGSRFRIDQRLMVFWFFYRKGKGDQYLEVDNTALRVRAYPGSTTRYVEYSLTEDGGDEINFGWNAYAFSGFYYGPYGGELLTLDAAPTPAAWSVGATVTGQSSGVTCDVQKVISSTQYLVTHPSGTFTDGEILSDGTNSRDCGVGYPQLPSVTSEVERMQLVLDFAVANDDQQNERPLKMDNWFEGTKVTCSSGTPTVPVAFSDLQDWVDLGTTRTDGPLGIITVEDVFINCKCAIEIGNGSDGTNNEGNLTETGKFILFNQWSEEVKCDLTVKNYSTLILGELELGVNGDYPVSGCQLVLPPNRYSDVSVENGGVFKMYDGKIYRWRYIYLGAASDTGSTCELNRVDVDSCETVYFRATTLNLTTIEVHDNPAEVNDHCGEMTVNPDVSVDIRVYNCDEGIHFRDTLDIEEYIAQDNTTYDLGVLEAKTVTFINSAFDPNKMLRMAT